MEENNKDNIEEIKDNEKNNAVNIKNEIFSWIKIIVSALIIATILRTFVFQMALVNQISMEPTLIEGQMLVISKVNYLLGNPQRGDIVVLKDNTENKLLIKRVIGMPGEAIRLQDGKVYVNDQELQDYTSAPTYPYSQESWTLPADQYFVLGDNREHSRDSRAEDVGLVDRDVIIGRAVFRIWPFNKLGPLK